MGQTIGKAAMKAGMHRNTATKYLKSRAWPSEQKTERAWLTREDPFEEDWPAIVARLEDAPEFEAKTLFEDLLARRPDVYHPGQLRTFQRHVKDWRARFGPAKDLFFPQTHRPGEAAQTDFTWVTELGITIAGQEYPHMLCHFALTYSNWSWATPCRSESMAAMKEGVQAALCRLGRSPECHQTDHSTAATHETAEGPRKYNEEYLELVGHYGMKPRTIAVGKSNQNGDVEALNGALKRSLEQHLLLRGSRDFEDHASYVAWLEGVLEQRNRLRERRLAEELLVMRPLPVHRLPAFSVLDPRVGPSSTIRIKSHTYSVPSRLKGERVRVRIFEGRLEIYHGGVLQLRVDRVRGRTGHRVEYRHLVDSMLRKPGAFRRYHYFDAFFPTSVFRDAFDVLDAALSRWKADVTYLRILRLAARTMESEVAKALRETLDHGEVPLFEHIEAMVAPREPSLPVVEIPEVELSGYDDLIEVAAVEVAQ